MPMLLHHPRGFGTAKPAPPPAWLAGAPLREWVEIPNTALRTASPAANAFSGTALFARQGRVLGVQAAAGGHTDSDDNRIVAIDYSDDAPAWSVVHARTTTTTPDVAYYADGRPVSRHLYWNIKYVPSLDRILLMGASATYQAAGQHNKIDGINPATWLWDGVVSDQPGISGSGYPDLTTLGPCVVRTGTDDLYGFKNYYQTWRWSAVDQVQVGLHDFGSGEFSQPLCWDDGRDQLVSIGFGNGAGSSTTLNAWVIAPSGTSRTAITFNAGAARTQWFADADPHAGMVYDPVDDVFYWFANHAGPEHVYVITPNSGSTWDIDFVDQGPASIVPSAGIGGAGVFNRFGLFFDGLLYLPAGVGENTLFMRLR